MSDVVTFKRLSRRRNEKELLLLLVGTMMILGWLRGATAAARPTPAAPALEISTTPNALREPVHPRRNVDTFEPVLARYVRFTILKCNNNHPCLDELEIYTAEESSRNVALASAGAKATVSGSLPGYKIHQPEHVNDGLYGNARSWISDQLGSGWVQIELAQPYRIDQVVWGRDREGKFIDRLPTEYRIEVALQPGQWRLVASSADRKPLPTGAEFGGANPGTRYIISQFAPTSTSLPVTPAPGLAEYAIDIWQTEDGLPSNTISSMWQTHDGYLWLGTFNGLLRFDGLRFQVFGEAEGLHNNRIICLLEDKDHTLWIGTEGGGLVRYRDGRFTTFTTREGLAHDVVLSLAQDAQGTLWVGTMGGLDRHEQGHFKHYASLYGAPIHSIQFDTTGQLWILEGMSLTVLRDGTISSPAVENEPSRFTSLQTLAAGRDGSIWIGSANGYVAKLSGGKAKVFGEAEGLRADSAWEICETRQGDLWVGTASGGLSRLRQGRFTTFTTIDGLPSNSVRTVYEDREGNLWIGFNGGGLARLKPKKLTTFTSRDGLSHNVIMSLAQDREGQLWIGSNGGGLNVRRNGTFVPYSPSYILDNECVWSLCAATNGTLWIGTWGDGLFCLRDGQLTNYRQADGLSDDVILALCEDGEGGLWIGTYAGGLNHLRDGSFTHVTTTNGLTANFVTCLLKDRLGTLWIGTSGGGLNQWREGKLSAFTREDGLASDFVRTLHEDDDGALWIGTGGGLSCLREGRRYSVTHLQGLVDDVISQILEDDEGRLWFGSNRGIFHVRKEELRAAAEGRLTLVNPVSYGKAEGMESLECTGGFHPAGLKTEDGRLWFSTVKGLVMVEPNKLSINQLPPPVVIEEVWADGKLLSLPTPSNEHDHSRSTSEGTVTGNTEKALRIGPGLDRLEFRYTALSLVAPEKVRFRHQLEGLDRQWVEAGTRRTAYYTHLPAGHYRFHVMACNNDGVWNESGQVLAFQVLPPFWLTWWFHASLAVTILGSGGWLVRSLSVRKLRGKLEQLKRRHALEKERARIAQDIHDDLGARLTQIALVGEIGQHHSHQPDNVQTHFRTITRTAREAVQSMDAIVWAVNPRNDSLDNLANYISQFAQDFFQHSPVRCRLDIPPHLPEHLLSSEVRHNLFLAVREALNNVARHSGANEVWIRLSADPHQLILLIEDNGRGFTVPPEGFAGDGLINMKRRIEELGGTFELHSSPAAGTRVRMAVRLLKPNGHPAAAVHESN